MNIGEFARLGGVSTRMLRHYDALGLLVPAHVDPFTARRSYDAGQLPVLNQLLALKGLGFSLDEVGKLLLEGITPAELQGMLRLREAELERQVRHDRHTLDRVRARLRLTEQETQMNVELKHVEAVTIAALSAPAADASRESTGAVVQALFDQVITRMEAASADRTTPIARYQPIAGQPTVQVTAGYVVPAGSVPDLEPHTLPTTEVASLLHHGPMSTISTTYQALTHWAATSNRTPTSPTWREHYLEAPDNAQSTWLVEVQLELS